MDEHLIEIVDKKVAASQLAGKFSVSRLAAAVKPPFGLAKAAEWPKIGAFSPEEVAAIRAAMNKQTPTQLATKIILGTSDAKVCTPALAEC
jgi:hypothetical protein